MAGQARLRMGGFEGKGRQLCGGSRMRPRKISRSPARYYDLEESIVLFPVLFSVDPSCGLGNQLGQVRDAA
jgi:hypothetical protein